MYVPGRLICPERRVSSFNKRNPIQYNVGATQVNQFSAGKSGHTDIPRKSADVKHYNFPGSGYGEGIFTKLYTGHNRNDKL